MRYAQGQFICTSRKFFTMSLETLPTKPNFNRAVSFLNSYGGGLNDKGLKQLHEDCPFMMNAHAGSVFLDKSIQALIRGIFESLPNRLRQLSADICGDGKIMCIACIFVPENMENLRQSRGLQEADLEFCQHLMNAVENLRPITDKIAEMRPRKKEVERGRHVVFKSKSDQEEADSSSHKTKNKRLTKRKKGVPSASVGCEEEVENLRKIVDQYDLLETNLLGFQSALSAFMVKSLGMLKIIEFIDNRPVHTQDVQRARHFLKTLETMEEDVESQSVAFDRGGLPDGVVCLARLTGRMSKMFIAGGDTQIARFRSCLKSGDKDSGRIVDKLEGLVASVLSLHQNMTSSAEELYEILKKCPSDSRPLLREIDKEVTPEKEKHIEKFYEYVERCCTPDRLVVGGPCIQKIRAQSSVLRKWSDMQKHFAEEDNALEELKSLEDKRLITHLEHQLHRGEINVEAFLDTSFQWRRQPIDSKDGMTNVVKDENAFEQCLAKATQYLEEQIDSFGSDPFDFIALITFSKGIDALFKDGPSAEDGDTSLAELLAWCVRKKQDLRFGVQVVKRVLKIVRNKRLFNEKDFDVFSHFLWGGVIGRRAHEDGSFKESIPRLMGKIVNERTQNEAYINAVAFINRMFCPRRDEVSSLVSRTEWVYEAIRVSEDNGLTLQKEERDSRLQYELRLLRETELFQVVCVRIIESLLKSIKDEEDDMSTKHELCKRVVNGGFAKVLDESDWSQLRDKGLIMMEEGTSIFETWLVGCSVS